MDGVWRFLLRHLAWLPAIALLAGLSLFAVEAARPASNAQSPPPPVDLGALRDSDEDGCSDAEEKGGNLSLGGLRDPGNFWDFFDTPTGARFTRDRAISVSDISSVVSRFGSHSLPWLFLQNDPFYPFPAPRYSAAFDRTVAGPYTWNLGPPDYSITTQDIILVVRQFGHYCRGPQPPIDLWNANSAWTWQQAENYVIDLAKAAQAAGVGELMASGEQPVTGQRFSAGTGGAGATVVCSDPSTGVFVIELDAPPATPGSAEMEQEIVGGPEQTATPQPTPTSLPRDFVDEEDIDVPVC